MQRIIGMFVCLFLTGTVGCSPAPQPGPVADKELVISNVLVLPLPSPTLMPAEEEQVLVYLGRQLHQVHGLRVYCGRAVGRSVWGELDETVKLASDAFNTGLSRGKKSYQQLRIGKSLSLLGQAQAALPYCGAEFKDFAPVIEMHLFTGLALLSQGQTEKAESEFRRAVSYDNKLDVSGRKFIPAQLEVFERARKQLLSGNEIPVDVNSIPPGAAVFIDGREIGKTPVAAKLYPGRHFARIELEGYTVWNINLPDGFPPSSFEAQLVPMWPEDPPQELYKQAFAGSELSGTVKEQLHSLAEFFHVDAVILTRLAKQDGKIMLSVRRYLDQPGTLTPVKNFGLGSGPAAFEGKIRSVVRKFTELGKKQKPKEKAKKKEPEKKKKIRKKKKSKKKK